MSCRQIYQVGGELTSAHLPPHSYHASWNYQSFYSPTNAQVIVLKIILKFTLRWLRHVSVQSHHPQGAHYPCLLKLLTGVEGTCWLPSIWCQKPLHRRISWTLWPAPYQNSNEYWCFAYNQKTSGSNFFQTSVICTVSTQCYTKGLLLKLEVPAQTISVEITLAANPWCLVEEWFISTQLEHILPSAKPSVIH